MTYNPIISLTKEEQDEANSFFIFLGTNIKEETIRVYYGAFKTMVNEYGLRALTKDEIMLFITKHKSSVYRAFIKNYIDYKDWNIKIPKLRGTKQYKIPATLTNDEQARLIQWTFEHSHDDGYAILFALLGECGLRISEGLGVYKNDFNIELFKQEKIGDNTPIELKVRGKGGKERIVVVSSALRKAIANYGEKVQGNKLFNLHIKSVQRKMYNACISLGFVKANGKPKYHPHSLRHTQGTNWYLEGIDIFEIRDRLGHTSIDTTQKYINPAKELAIRKWKDISKQNAEH